MTDSKPKQPTDADIFKALTPRQRCSISDALHANDQSVPDPRHHRINGSIQSILTFEVNELARLIGHGDDERDRSVDGWFGIWHGRVSTHPVSLVDGWDSLTTAKAEGIITRLLSRAGLDEDTEIHLGSDEKSIHFYKWATHQELAIAEKRLGKKFAKMGARNEN